MKKQSKTTNLTRAIELTFGLIFLLIVLASCEKEALVDDETIENVSVEDLDNTVDEVELFNTDDMSNAGGYTLTEEITIDGAGGSDQNTDGTETSYTGLEFVPGTNITINGGGGTDQINGVEGQNTGFVRPSISPNGTSYTGLELVPSTPYSGTPGAGPIDPCDIGIIKVNGLKATGNETAIVSDKWDSEWIDAFKSSDKIDIECASLVVENGKRIRLTKSSVKRLKRILKKYHRFKFRIRMKQNGFCEIENPRDLNGGVINIGDDTRNF